MTFLSTSHSAATAEITTTVLEVAMTSFQKLELTFPKKKIILWLCSVNDILGIFSIVIIWNFRLVDNNDHSFHLCKDRNDCNPAL